MAGITLDFQKTPANRRVTVWLGPKGSIANFDAPQAAEINAMFMASKSISWNDFDFGLQESEELNDPSLADVASFADFGAANYGGSISFYYPHDYFDNASDYKIAYDLTDIPWTELEIVIRIDGDVKTSAPAVDGDLVSVYHVMTDSETNAITGADAMRRTVGMLSQGAFAHRVVVGDPTITASIASASIAVGEASLITALIGGRGVTAMLNYRSENPGVATVSQAGAVKGISSGSAEITIENPGTDEVETVTVTVA